MRNIELVLMITDIAEVLTTLLLDLLDGLRNCHPLHGSSSNADGSISLPLFTDYGNSLFLWLLFPVFFIQDVVHQHVLALLNIFLQFLLIPSQSR